MRKSRQFHSCCERMRYRALRDGEGSQAYQEWRAHSKTCPECQTALHLMGLLAANEPSEELAIEPARVEMLVEKAREKYRSKPSWAVRLWRSSWKVAAVVAIATLCNNNLQLEKAVDAGATLMLETIGRNAAVTVLRNAGAESSAYGFEAGTDTFRDSQALLAPGEAASQPEVLPLSEMDHAIEELRDGIHSQMSELNNLIDSDLTKY